MESNPQNPNPLVLTGSTGPDSPPHVAGGKVIQPRFRRDLDRVIHAKRLRAFADDLADCAQPQVPLALRAFELAHADFEAAQHLLREEKADWRKARRTWRKREELGYKAVLFVAEQLRKKPDREWDAEATEDFDQQERLDHLLNGQVPKLIRRDAKKLAETLRRLDGIFTADDAEASTWPKRLVDAVGPLADQLDAVVKEDEQAKRAYRRALSGLGVARKWWNHAWDHAERTVNHFVKLSGGDPVLLEAFYPVRYKATGSPGPVEDPDGGDAVEREPPDDASGLSEEGG